MDGDEVHSGILLWTSLFAQPRSRFHLLPYFPPSSAPLAPGWCLFPVNIIMGCIFRMKKDAAIVLLCLCLIWLNRVFLYTPLQYHGWFFFQIFHSSFSFEKRKDFFFLFLEHNGERFCFYFGRRMLNTDFSFFYWRTGEEWNETTTLWKWILPSAE